jgi:hypothetical protein
MNLFMWIQVVQNVILVVLIVSLIMTIRANRALRRTYKKLLDDLDLQ